MTIRNPQARAWEEGFAAAMEYCKPGASRDAQPNPYFEEVDSADVDALSIAAKDWRKQNDGGLLGIWWPAGSKPGDDSQPIIAVTWDNGGTDELGVFYDAENEDKLEFIMAVFNYGLELLAPSEVEYGWAWGSAKRTYL